MAEVVSAPARGLELYRERARAKPLKAPAGLATGLHKLGIRTVQDLLQHYPRYHVDRTQLRTVREITESYGDDGGEVQIHARVVRMDRPLRVGRPGPKGKRKTLIKAQIGDETGTIDVTWFNQEWVARALTKGAEAFFYGRLGTFRGRLQMTAPRFEIVRSGREPFNVGRIIPIYPATAELSSDRLRRLMWAELDRNPEILDPLPEKLRTRLGLMSRTDAIRLIHFPDDKQDVLEARERIVFDELFSLQLGLVQRKRRLERTVQGISHRSPGAGSLAETFLASLPFEPTGAQRRACGEVAADMARPCPMHRLVEGEVGSGKTVVAVYACLNAVDNNHQAALMAPTEVLAEQHHLTVCELLDRSFGSEEARNLFASISKRPVVRLLTGSTPAGRREEILAEVAAGEVDLLIGTHVLIEDSVAFAKLGVAVVDEQHRFGVHQRRALREKSGKGEPDILVMTATPIPRTLAVAIYGDLDVSILDELPDGRKKISTKVAEGDEGRARAYELIRKETESGRQAFVVYALREESEAVDLRSAKTEAGRLAEEVFPDLRVGLVHGDMRSDDKEAAMSAFRDGDTQVLVATTVVEVGVDVPNATVMLIEDADRFGLAQLHQLRGRVGRGEHVSHCILVTDLELGSSDPAAALAAERLQAIEATMDGFRLAEVDLRQRGEGQLFGARQSGMPDLRLARVLEHQTTVKVSRDLAVEVLDGDPDLDAWEHSALAREVRDRFAQSAIEVVQSG